LSLKEKLELIIEQEFDFFMEHPELPMFILHSIQQKNIKIPMPREVVNAIANTGIFEQFEKAKQSGEVRDISLRNTIILLMSNMHYPFMSKNLHKELHQISEDQLNQDLLDHKIIVKEMIINYLFISNTKA
jgi:hypothetical protein